MVTLGKGATAAVAEQISSLGTNILQIRPGQGFGRGGGGPQAARLRHDDVDAIRDQVAGVTRGRAAGAGVGARGPQWRRTGTTTVNGTTSALLHRPATGR